jgi:hypothetical protein
MICALYLKKAVITKAICPKIGRKKRERKKGTDGTNREQKQNVPI